MKLQMSMLCAAVTMTGLLVLTSCKDDTVTRSNGQLSLYLTDSPVDRADVQAVVVTIAEVRLDGQAWEGFDGPLTVDLLSYQGGMTKLMGSSEADAKTYSDIDLVLDLEQDASGNTPGCYVMTEDQMQHALSASGATELLINIDHSAFSVEDSQESNLVIDFDLRKSITYASGNSDFAFTTNSELNSALRLVSRDNTGEIEGQCDDAVNTSDLIVVYAYAKGTYNQSVEPEGQGASQIRFANAVTSSSVDGTGHYKLSFLESGDYELVFASYAEQSDGTMMLQGTLLLDTLLNIDLQSISVAGNASVEVDVLVTGLLPL